MATKPEPTAPKKDTQIEVFVSKKQFIALGQLLGQQQELQKALQQTFTTLAQGSDADTTNASLVKAEARKGAFGKEKFVLVLSVPAKDS